LQLKMRSEESQNFSWFTTWMRLCFSGKMIETMDFIGEISKVSRDEQKAFLNFTLRIIRQALFVETESNELVRMNNEESGFVIGAGSKRFYPYVHPQNIHLIAGELNESIYHIERNAHAGILFLDLSFKLGNYLKMPKG